MTSTYSFNTLYEVSFNNQQVFNPGIPVETSLPLPIDLDNDGYDEIIISGYNSSEDVARHGIVFDVNSTAQISIATNIIAPEEFDPTVWPRRIISDDFNGDGYNDVFVAAHGWDFEPFPGEANVLLLSNGDGQLSSAPVPFFEGEFSHSAASVDVDRDGDLDIYVANIGTTTNTVIPYMLINNGAGSFVVEYDRLPSSVIDPAHYSRFLTVEFADLDRDGFEDMVLGKIDSEVRGEAFYSKVFFNDGTGRFNDNAAQNLPDPKNIGQKSISYEIVPMDVDNDGDLDILHVHTGDNGQFINPGWEVQLLINDGSGNFSDDTASAFRLGENFERDPGYHMKFLRTIDLNNDGFLDLVPYFEGSGEKYDAPAFWLNDGVGRFGAIFFNEILSEDNAYLAGRAVPVTTPDGVEFVQMLAINGDIWNDPLNLTAAVSTGPGGANPASSGAAGFNELFYLNSNSDVQALVDNGTYASGLAHYLAVGMSEGRSGMASGANVSGTNADDNFTMAHGNSIVRLYAGNDSFVSGNGNDTVDGGTGTDTAVFSGARSDYVVFTSNGITTVMDLAANRDGTDFLQNIENLTFSTETMTLAAAVVEPVDADGSPFQIYRFYNTLTGSHFFTTSIEERNSVITNIPTMTYEGNSFDSNATEAGGGVAVHRFYNSDSGFHFYTASGAEAQSIQNSLPQFSYEGIAYYASETADAGGTALYRFFNTQSGSHFYTASADERDSIISTLGHYDYEGVAFYVDAA